MMIQTKKHRAANRNAMGVAAGLPRGLDMLESRVLFSTFVVDNNPADHAAYVTIQAAVNVAHAGDVVQVKAGTYPEAVTIPAADCNLQLIAKGSLVTIASPAGAVAAVSVNGASGVSIQGFTISGSGTTGIAVNGGGTATITHNHITGPSGVLSGFYNGVDIASGSGRLSNNVVDDYQKRGILVGTATENLPANPSSVNLAQAYGDIENNVVVGAGPATIVQNGIVFSFGACGFIEDNTVSGHIDGPQDGISAGILMFDAGATVVSNNTAYGNDSDIVLDSGSEEGMSFIAPGLCAIDSNLVYGATYDGIESFGSVGAIVSNNKSQYNAADGVYVEMSSNIDIDNNNANSNDLNGIELVGTDCSLIVNNQANNNGDNGIVLENSDGNLVINNVTKANAGAGIDLSASDDDFLALNTTKNNGVDGIDLTDSSGNVITLNNASKNGVFGIQVDFTSTNNVFCFDKINKNGVAAVFDASQGTGTDGTANLWIYNRGHGQTIPTGLIRA